MSTSSLETQTITPTTSPTYETLKVNANNVHSKKFNTERFMRLSQRPPKYRLSPVLRYRLPAQSKSTDTAILGKSAKGEATQVSIIINK